jgi:hypothetical protein
MQGKSHLICIDIYEELEKFQNDWTDLDPSASWVYKIVIELYDNYDINCRGSITQCFNGVFYPITIECLHLPNLIVIYLFTTYTTEGFVTVVEWYVLKRYGYLLFNPDLNLRR